jgi:hypothetical protein
MNNEPKVVRRNPRFDSDLMHAQLTSLDRLWDNEYDNVWDVPIVEHVPPRFGSALPPDQMIQKYHRTDPNRYVPFAEDKDYIRADRWDNWAAVVIGIAVLIVVGLDGAWLLGWLP